MSRPRQPPPQREPILRVTVQLRLSRQVGWIALGIALGNINRLDDLLEAISHVVHALPQ